MAHPHKSEVSAAHNAKLRGMTRHYGLASGPADNIISPQERLKGEEGPEAHVGFGAEGDAATARSDRPARRSASANPIATYARGGKVKHKEDGGKVPMPRPRPEGREPDASDLYSSADSKRLSSQRAQGGVIARARGGRAKHGKGATHVNVIVTPQGGAPGMPPMGGPPPQLAALAAGARPPMGGPPMPPPGGPPGGPPMPMGGPLPGGPMPPRAKGGRVHTPHGDEAEDKALINKTLKEEGLIRKARGGGIHMTAGALTGEGRLEKMGIKIPSHRGELKSPKKIKEPQPI